MRFRRGSFGFSSSLSTFWHYVILTAGLGPVFLWDFSCLKGMTRLGASVKMSVPWNASGANLQKNNPSDPTPWLAHSQDPHYGSNISTLNTFWIIIAFYILLTISSEITTKGDILPWGSLKLQPTKTSLCIQIETLSMWKSHSDSFFIF